jgi:hypothetical protein
MKRSTAVLLVALGIVIALIVAMAIFARVSLGAVLTGTSV